MKDRAAGCSLVKAVEQAGCAGEKPSSSRLPLLRLGACAAWDEHTIALAARPFARTSEPPHSRTALSYAVPADSPLVTAHGFGGAFDVGRIGVQRASCDDTRSVD